LINKSAIYYKFDWLLFIANWFMSTACATFSSAFTFTGEKMASYAELQAQIKELEQKAAAARSAELADAKARIIELMNTYGLTTADLSAGAGKSKFNKTKSVAAKYKDPVSGATWTGRGRAPLWLKDKDRDTYLIQ